MSIGEYKIRGSGQAAEIHAPSEKNACVSIVKGQRIYSFYFSEGNISERPQAAPDGNGFSDDRQAVSLYNKNESFHRKSVS